MRKDTPVNTQVPEWKKEVAEKVKAYGERKKRLTTPPQALRKNNEAFERRDSPVEAVSSSTQMPEPASPDLQAKVISGDVKEVPAAETAGPFEIWPEDLQGLPGIEQIQDKELQEAGPYLLRRIFAGLVDHTMLAVLMLAFLFVFSFFMGESMNWLILSSWKGTLSLFLVMHFTYHLYFFRVSRQTPGMLFVSLELRDPASSVIPLGKIIVRWFAFMLLNIFNFLPVLLGKNFLLLDQLSGTEMRSFK